MTEPPEKPESRIHAKQKTNHPKNSNSAFRKASQKPGSAGKNDKHNRQNSGNAEGHSRTFAGRSIQHRRRKANTALRQILPRVHMRRQINLLTGHNLYCISLL